MALTKVFKIIDPRSSKVDITDNNNLSSPGGLYGNYTWYHRLVQGSPHRLTRYREFDLMDNDVDVARALDIVAEEMVGNNPKTEMPLEIFIMKEGREIPSSMVVTLNAALKTWCTINDWQHRLFSIARNTVKYGDCFFKRPKKRNGKLEYIHVKNVIGAVVSEMDISDIRGWHIKIDNKHIDKNQGNSLFFNVGSSIGDSGVEPYNTDDIIRFSLNDDMSEEAPFGASILRAVYRTFKQKELLEDALIIYRIVRAPERLVFKIATGTMPPHKVAQHLEQIKNEITQKKIPSNAGGTDAVESVYNAHSMSKNYFFAQPKDGNGSSVEVLPGGCLDLSTRIPLLDGRILTLSEMIAEHKAGITNWIYSVNPSTGEPLPGLVSWAGITHENAEVYEIELDNGETFIVTGDHQHPVWGKGVVRTIDLVEDDSFIHFEKKFTKIKSNTNEYEQVYDHNTKKWVFTHRLVMDHFDDSDTLVIENSMNETNCNRNVIHHVDFNRYNNSPNNLIKIHWKDHFKLHSDQQYVATKAALEKYHSDSMYRENVISRLQTEREKFKKLLAEDNNEYIKYCNKVSVGVISYISKLGEVARNKRAVQSKLNFAKATTTKLNMIATDVEYKNAVYSKSGKTLSNRLSVGGDLRDNVIQHLNEIRRPIKNQEIQFCDDMITIVRHYVDNGVMDVATLLSKLNNLPKFMIVWNGLNVGKDGFVNKICSEFKHHHLTMLLNKHGYANWKEFKAERMKLAEISPDIFADMTCGMDVREVELFKFIINQTKLHSSAYRLCEVLNNDMELKIKFIDMCKLVFNTSQLTIDTILRTNHFNEIAKYYGYNTFKHFTQEKSLFNHRVKTITKLDSRAVGTLTIDQNEKYNKFHTFAIMLGDSDSVGLYTKNSGLGELADLKYFFDKMWRGLKIPQSYIDTTTESGGVANDGKVGIAYLQEIKFALYIERLQRYLERVFDKEFKQFLYDSGIIVDPTIFKVLLPQPSNWSTSKQQEMDAALLNTYGAADGIATISKRFAKRKYLQWSEAEIAENERSLAEEKGLNPDRLSKLDLPKLYSPEDAEAGGFEGGLGGSGGMVGGPSGTGELDLEGSNDDFPDMDDEGDEGADTDDVDMEEPETKEPQQNQNKQPPKR